MEQAALQSARVAGADILRIEGVSKRFVSAEGAVVSALDGISLTISSGRFTTLLGPSGCGKTTLLRAIAGFEEPDEGMIWLGGEDITARPPFRRPVSTVFQHYALFPHLSVAGNVAYGLEVTRVARSAIRPRVDAALELVRLSGFGNRRIAQLSGGQQQRVALARSLALQPEVLLLDEPLAALDRNLRKDMQVELKRLQNEVGIAFLCVTHDQEEALSMSDTVVVMNEGRIEQIGSPREIYERPATRFVAGFVGEAAILPCRRQGGEVSGVSRFVLSDGQTLLCATPAAGATAAGDVVAVIRPERLRVREGVSGAGRELAATVRQSIYLGEKTRIEADVGNGRIIALVDGATTPPAPGQSIRLTYDPADVHMVPA